MRKTIFTRLAKKLLLNNGYYQLDKDAHASFSQMAEDLIVKKFFFEKDKGFYVDIGAFDPKLYSNTYIFYLKGWRGINVDASKKSIENFSRERPNDININAAVSSKESEVTYYVTNSGALNTISEVRKREIDKLQDHKIIEKYKLKTTTLRKILDQNLPKNKQIDILSIDVEGHDYDVLRSNDWEKYKPTVIIIESLTALLTNINDDKIYKYLTRKGYSLESKTGVSLIFKKKNDK